VTLDVVGKVDDGTRPEGFIAPRVTGDALFTASGTDQYGIEQNGTIVYVMAPASSGNDTGQTVNVTSPSYYYFDAIANVWKKIGDDSNIFTSNGTLTDTRVMDMNNNTFGMINGKLSVGSNTPHPSSILQIESNNRGFLPPRMTKLQMEAIVNPSLALMVYCTDCFAGNTGCLMINDSVDETTPRWGTLCSSNVPVPNVENLACDSSTLTGIIYEGQDAGGINVLIPYTNANGASYAQSSFVRNGLKFSLPAGTLANGDGHLLYHISGVPINVGSMTVEFLFAGKACNVQINVMQISTVLLPGNDKAWMRHNLGADMSLDPDIPVQEIGGNYYQWGRYNVAATAGTPEGTIVGWDATSAPNDAWLDTEKTVNDPCPTGFRIPTDQQMYYLYKNSSQTTIGTFTNSPSNFGSAKVFSSGTAKLTLPASGARDGLGGLLIERGSAGYYWTSSVSSGNLARRLKFKISSVETGMESFTRVGLNLRCIRE